MYIYIYTYIHIYIYIEREREREREFCLSAGGGNHVGVCESNSSGTEDMKATPPPGVCESNSSGTCGENEPSKLRIRGWRAVSTAALPGKGRYERSAFVHPSVTALLKSTSGSLRKSSENIPKSSHHFRKTSHHFRKSSGNIQGPM